MPAKKKVDPQVKPPKVELPVPTAETHLSSSTIGTDMTNEALAPGDERTWAPVTNRHLTVPSGLTAYSALSDDPT